MLLFYTVLEASIWYCIFFLGSMMNYLRKGESYSRIEQKNKDVQSLTIILLSGNVYHITNTHAQIRPLLISLTKEHQRGLTITHFLLTLIHTTVVVLSRGKGQFGITLIVYFKQEGNWTTVNMTSRVCLSHLSG